MSYIAQIAALGTPAEIITPELRATLLEQQNALLAARRDVQMFPTGTDELPCPEGFRRLTTPRGVFHYAPDRIAPARILEASHIGRENEILGLGPYSKSDVLAAGPIYLAVVERTAAGLEVLSAMAAPAWASEVAAFMRERAGPDHTITIEPPEKVLAERKGVANGAR